MKPTARVERLREAFLHVERSSSIDRARIEGRVMRETEGEPMITRRSKVFAAVLREIPIDICPEELIVGLTSVRSLCANVIPAAYTELQARRATGVVDAGRIAYPGLTDEEVREIEEDLAPYWERQGRVGLVATWHYGHNIHGMEKVVKKGFLGIKKEAEERLARLDLAEPEDLKKVPFLQGVAMVMEAAAEFGQRYAAGARELAEKEQDATGKAELLRIAEVCDWVPANPARTFREALQSYHFAWLMLTLELYHNIAFALGKMDQYLYPYYERDIREGRTTREEAQELLDCYILKLNYVGIVGQSSSGSIGVGGVKADGNDATNELSYMFIESIMHTRLADPWLAVHLHSRSPDDFLIKVAELTSLGSGHPQFLNADVMVAQALARGGAGGRPVTLEDARSASNVGCLELAIPGKDSGYLVIGGTNLAAAMELVLTNGVRRSDGERIGLETGDPRQFKSFEEVQEAFRQQVAWMRRNTQIDGDAFEQKLIDLYPMVYESALIEDCIENGLCREEGGARYNNTQTVGSGATDAGDSLAAIKKLVFDDKKITMTQLCDALDANFEGREDIRKMCSEIPKFGNDDDYVDEQVAWVTHVWASEFQKITNLRGGHCSPGGSPMAGYIPAGKEVGALPSGRLAGEPLAPAACPSTGKDVNGVTAVLKSMGKIDNVEPLSGLALTSRIDPAVFKSRDGMKRMADLLRAFVDQKIFHLQLNVVSSDTLRAAQEEPEKHRGLMVKVAGYNAYFTQQSRELQDTIIARTEHGL
ncbi:MAG: glycyl radical protein [Candidatus Bathyanammoxibius sp.]